MTALILAALIATALVMAALVAWPRVAATAFVLAPMGAVAACVCAQIIERRLTSDAYIGKEEAEYEAMKRARPNQGPARDKWRDY